jgi:uncharacterized damage-inducible protein DinB
VTANNPVTEPLAAIFRLNDGFITRALDGLSEADVHRRPSDRSNSMFWLLGHVVHTRGSLVRILGGDFRTGWGDTFRRGALHRDPKDYPSLASIEQTRGEAMSELLTRLTTASSEQLGKPAAGPPLPNVKTVGDQIAFLAFHESYHVGQMAFVRKMLGHTAVAG